MLNYLKSRELKDADSFYFNLSLELLTGCQFSCAGCFVNKEAPVVMTDAYYEQLLGVLDSASASGYHPFLAVINPTDFLVANNTAAIMSDPRVVEVVNRFQRLSLQSTFLNPFKAAELGAVFRTHYGTMELELNMIIEPDKITNPKYLRTLAQNQALTDRLFDWPTPIQHFGVMNVFDYSQTRRAEILRDYPKIQAAVDHLVTTTIDFNFSLGRKGRALTPTEFQTAAMQIKTLYDESFTTAGAGQAQPLSKSGDSVVERHYNWANGRFYYSPLLYERYVSFIPEFEIPLPNSAIGDIEQYEQQVELEQYANVANKDECGECPLLMSCVNKGILKLMDVHAMRACPVARNAIAVVNVMGTLPL